MENGSCKVVFVSRLEDI